MKLGNENIEP